MKRIWIAVVAALLGLWIGYDVGYHHGTQKERTAWEDSEEVVLDEEDGKLVASYLTSAATPTGRVKRVTTGDYVGRGNYHSNPHVGRRVFVQWRRQVNAADPRNTPVK